MTKHDLKEYKFAKDICKDFPFIQKEMNVLYKKLYKYRQFLAVQHVLDALADSESIIKLQYEYYKKILEAKGEVK